MKEKLYTIELNDAVRAGDECIFCWLERKLEQETLEFVLGCSYMESDIREQTDHLGFCRHHTKMMFDYGNSLGNAWILKSRLEYLNKELKGQMKKYTPQKSAGVFAKWNKKTEETNVITGFIKEQESHCYLCNRMEQTYGRMLNTFVYQLRHDPEFCRILLEGKGFCMHHFSDVIETCEEKLKEEEKKEWIPKLTKLMTDNLDRMQEDINWLIEKYDHCNRAADWKNSKDALPRTMQKIVGGHPADPVFKDRK